MPQLLVKLSLVWCSVVVHHYVQLNTPLEGILLLKENMYVIGKFELLDDQCMAVIGQMKSCEWCLIG
jgi:hypothetical protein